MSMLEKRNANKASLAGHLIPKPGDKNKFLHMHTQKKRGLKIIVER